MLNAGDLRFSRLGDAAPGSVLLVKAGRAFVPGLRVKAPDGSPGALIFPAKTADSMVVPYWATTNGRVVVVATHGYFRWDGKAVTVTDTFIDSPPVGHLRVVGDKLAVSGFIPGLSTHDSPTYWDTTNGEIVTVSDFGATCALAQWEMGVILPDDTFHQIATFPFS